MQWQIELLDEVVVDKGEGGDGTVWEQDGIKLYSSTSPQVVPRFGPLDGKGSNLCGDVEDV